MFTDRKCHEYASAFPNQIFEIRKNYCNASRIQNDQYCRNWAGSGDTAGKIDSLMVTNFCQQFPKDPLCTCVLSEIDCPNKFDINCIRKLGYRTTDMIKTPCPNIMNCTQFVSLSPGAQALATNVEQNCTSITNTGSSSGGPKPGPAPVVVTNNNDLGAIIPTWAWFLIALIIFVLVGGGVYFAFFSEDDEPEESKPPT
jgi:hypothetical protein